MYCHIMQVRITEAEKDVPLYVVIRKWIQNDPDSEIMPAPAHGDDLAEAKRSLAPRLPSVPAPTEEELHMDVQPVEAPVAPNEDGSSSVEVRCVPSSAASLPILVAIMPDSQCKSRC
jgi:hypothetical protein